MVCGAGRRCCESVDWWPPENPSPRIDPKTNKQRASSSIQGHNYDVEGVEGGVRDGVGLVGALGRLPSPRLARGLSADWKTCQVTLAPPTHLNN